MYSEISKLYYNSLKSKAKARKISFDITLEEIKELFKKQDGRCGITNLPIVPKTYKTRKKEMWTASLDRIDSKKGYTIKNVQWVHKEINMLKGKLPKEKFIDLCNLVVNGIKEIYR